MSTTLQANSPLDGRDNKQNFQNLLQACRAGDLERVESCLYGALTEGIRELLLSHEFTKAVDETQPYRHFLGQLFEKPLESFCDVVFKLVSNNNFEIFEFAAHRCILCARSKYFAKKFETTWLTSKIITIHRNPLCFREILRYLYTGEIGEIQEEYTMEILALCYEFDLDISEEYLNKSSPKRAQEREKSEIQRLQQDLEHFCKTRVIRDRRYSSEDQVAENSLSAQELAQADLIINVGNRTFPCHRAFLTRRSDYFKAMFTGSFSESIFHHQQDNKNLPVFKLSGCTPEVFSLILEFIYTDKCEIPPSISYDVLVSADMYLLDKLKSIASIALTNLKEPIKDIYTLMRTALDLGVERLESWCSHWFADHINEVLEEPQFLELVEESAASIKQRQETDTIPLIDEIRYWLSKKYCVLEEDVDKKSGRVMEHEGEEILLWEEEYNKILERIDQALEKLKLDA
ncbi:14210_t:CDS:2 [Acaulospora morrowiae]|uniref:14210_t:CDS:1 n=1 Tax=Acaulospora morrowiae TaxID=94023 RepID=A0A9N9CYY1_9GLOM|nr:14210_t:CDS:2 [Acaulospora morrowiae]